MPIYFKDSITEEIHEVKCHHTNEEHFRSCSQESLISFILNIFNHNVTRKDKLCDDLAKRYWEQRKILKEWLEKEYE